MMKFRIFYDIQVEIKLWQIAFKLECFFYQGK